MFVPALAKENTDFPVIPAPLVTTADVASVGVFKAAGDEPVEVVEDPKLNSPDADGFGVTFSFAPVSFFSVFSLLLAPKERPVLIFPPPPIGLEGAAVSAVIGVIVVCPNEKLPIPADPPVAAACAGNENGLLEAVDVANGLATGCCDCCCWACC